MRKSKFTPFTANEVALALGISDLDELTGEHIAGDMLAGIVELEDYELETLASYKGVSVSYLTEHDPAFLQYTDPVTRARKEIAAKLLCNGMDTETAAEITALPPDIIKKLI